MNHLQKFRIATILNWVSFDFIRKYHISQPWVAGTYYNIQKTRFFWRKRCSNSEKGDSFSEVSSKNGEKSSQISRGAIEEARVSLKEYLHSTRNLQFTDAEFISLNSPNFLRSLLRKAKNEAEIGWCMSRFLRYHPINEFEPFFESMGLKESEYCHFLPGNLMFLNDDTLMLENYHVLCNYGVPRNRIGNIYKQAKEIFTYGIGVLESKFQALEEMGLNQFSLIKVVSSCPYLLVGDKYKEFRKLLNMFQSIGVEYDLIEGRTVEGNSYNWSGMYELLCLLSNMGCSDEQLRKFISARPMLLLESSRSTPLLIIGSLLKLGLDKSEICCIFLEFPKVPIGKFLFNWKRCFQFLVDIEMEAPDIRRIVRSHPSLLGSCSLKKLNTIIVSLNAGKIRLCDLVNENPQILKDWVLGLKIRKLSNSGVIIKSQEMKIKFLLSLGFVENSVEMERALKVFRGKGEELQERFDYFVNVGLHKEDVVEMIKAAPQILNQRRDVTQVKIDFLVKELGYPVSTLAKFPAYVSYTLQRVKLRHSMYKWLEKHGVAEPYLSLSTILACSNSLYMRRYVMKHPQGLEVYEKMKKEIYSDSKLYA